MTAHLDTLTTVVTADNGLGAPMPFGELAIDRYTVLGAAEAAAAATICIDTTVSFI